MIQNLSPLSAENHIQVSKHMCTKTKIKTFENKQYLQNHSRNIQKKNMRHNLRHTLKLLFM